LIGTRRPTNHGQTFNLPPSLEASAPPEVRGTSRDDVRLMVSRTATDEVIHTEFNEIGSYLQPGDVLVINTSRTLKAALPASHQSDLRVHISTQLPDGSWTVELRHMADGKSSPYLEAAAGQVIQLPGNANVRLIDPYAQREDGGTRLWHAQLDLPDTLFTYLDRHGEPIRYNYVNEAWPIGAYQTIYANEPGSAEMPSAGRAFTPEIITGLVAKGVHIVPLVLHTGVASLEANEPPYEEYFRIPEPTADLITLAKQKGRRIIAVGTTAVRALESATSPDGAVSPGEGWTDLVITPERHMQIADGMLTGFHEPQASHLAMLEALAGRPHIDLTYQAALENGYLWHEFGDLHLILP